MALNSISPTTFTTGVLITDTSNTASGNGIIANKITASTALDIQSTLGALCLPRMTTTQRLALTASNGMMVFDTTIGSVFTYAGGWTLSSDIIDGGMGGNLFIGTGSGNKTATGTLNTGTGYNTLHALTSGVHNSAFGYSSLESNTTGTGNSSFGYQALQLNTTGIGNAAFGLSVLTLNLTGDNNSGFGAGALSANTASNNSAFGSNALSSVSTGTQNTGVGVDALGALTATNGNTAIGYNTANGHAAYNNCTFVGATADATMNNLTNATAIGFGAQVASSNSMVLGNGANVGIGITAPTYLLHLVSTNQAIAVEGGFIGKVTTANAATYTVLPGDFIIKSLHSLTGTQTITLPAPAAGNTGQMYFINDADGHAGTNNITIGTAGGMINGGATIVINADHGAFRVYSDGTNWFTI
jgi:hypothetical protein